MKLYSYWRSSAAWRVRIALALKQVPHDLVPVHLVADGGHQHHADYVALNPQHLVPTLLLDNGTALTQSLAIIDWLEAACPQPALYPTDPMLRAKVLAASHAIAMDVHPVNNLRILNKLGESFGADADAKKAWMQHWMNLGLDALDKMIAPGHFCFGDTPTLADLCLVPQLYNARRWRLDVNTWARLATIEENCLALPSFSSTAPELQPDAT